MNILGLHREPWHDTGAAVIKEEKGEIKVISITQERLDRVKDSRAFPEDAIQYCLKEQNIKSLDGVDLIVSDYIEVPVWNRDRVIKNDYHPLLHGVTDVKNTEFKNIPAEKLAIINHHQAHAAATFYASGFEEAAVLVVDGRGSEKETQSIYLASKKNGIKLIEKTDVLGLGLLYATITVKIGFGILNEGKTMGLAPYGDDGRKKDIINWRGMKFDRVTTDYTGICQGRYDLSIKLPKSSESVDARLAYEVQTEIEKGMLYLAKYAQKITNTKYLCISGGVGLNSVANYRILTHKIYKDIFIQPACSDTGVPLGCALHGYYQILKGQKPYIFSAYLGKSYTDKEIEDAINKFTGFEAVTKNVTRKTVDYIAANKVVGWFQGASEIGPRALGNRSILMSAAVAENKDILNAKVKHREAFRPFAPAVLEEKASEYFVLDRPSPYMLLIADVNKKGQKLVPAITHYDKTARVQTVNPKQNKRFYDLIKMYGDRTGTYVVLNTSFNVAGEPIVETPEDAIRCFLGTGIDVLCIGNNLLVKNRERISDDRRSRRSNAGRRAR